MIIKTVDEFKIDGSKEEIINDVFEVFLAFAKKSNGQIPVHMLFKELEDLYSKKVKEQIDADIEKLYKNSNYGLLKGGFKNPLEMGYVSLKDVFNDELKDVLEKINHNSNSPYSFQITNENDNDELDIIMYMGGAIFLNFVYTKEDCRLSKVIIKEINWHLNQIACNNKDYYNDCDAEYLQGYWKDLLIGIRDTLNKD